MPPALKSSTKRYREDGNAVPAPRKRQRKTSARQIAVVAKSRPEAPSPFLELALETRYQIYGYLFNPDGNHSHVVELLRSQKAQPRKVHSRKSAHSKVKSTSFDSPESISSLDEDVVDEDVVEGPRPNFVNVSILRVSKQMCEEVIGYFCDDMTVQLAVQLPAQDGRALFTDYQQSVMLRAKRLNIVLDTRKVSGAPRPVASKAKGYQSYHKASETSQPHQPISNPWRKYLREGMLARSDISSLHIYVKGDLGMPDPLQPRHDHHNCRCGYGHSESRWVYKAAMDGFAELIKLLRGVPKFKVNKSFEVTLWDESWFPKLSTLGDVDEKTRVMVASKMKVKERYRIYAKRYRKLVADMRAAALRG